MSHYSSSSYTSIPVSLPMCDAWGYLGVTAPATPTVIDNSNVADFKKIANGRFGVTFSASSRFSSGAYVVVSTPECCDDTNYPLACCRIADIAGSTALGRSAGFEFNTFNYSTSLAGGTANFGDPSTDTLRVGFAAFSFSQDNRAFSVTGTTYATVPGASGFGVTGATYNSQLTNLLSKRTATAYGTVVIPPARGNSTPVAAYVENFYNVSGVSAGANSVFDITFTKPLNNTNYCVILSGENESTQDTVVTSSIGSSNEFSHLIVRAGQNNKFKTRSGFRIESRKQTAAGASNNQWTLQSVAYQNGRTERIHFMVFGGATYGQP